MFLLSMVVLGVFIIHTIGELILRMGLVIVMMMAVFVFPTDLFVMAHHGSRKVMKGIRMTMTSIPTVSGSIYATSVFVV